MMKQLVKIAFVILLVVISLMAQVKPEQPPGAVYWVGKGSDGSSFVLELLPTGDLRFIPVTGVVSKWKWKQKDKAVEMELNWKYVRLTGVIAGDHLEGKAVTMQGAQWAWSATKQPEMVAIATPLYPSLAQITRISGPVLVDVMIEASGAVIGVQIIQGHPHLREAAENAARRCKFQPAAGTGTRHARLTYIFTLLDVNEDKVQIINRLILSPYQMEVRRGWTPIQYD